MLQNLHMLHTGQPPHDELDEAFAHSFSGTYVDLKRYTDSLDIPIPDVDSFMQNVPTTVEDLVRTLWSRYPDLVDIVRLAEASEKIKFIATFPQEAQESARSASGDIYAGFRQHALRAGLDREDIAEWELASRQAKSYQFLGERIMELLRDRKANTEHMDAEQEDTLQPKAPEFLQKLKWLWVYGLQHKWYVLAGALVMAATSIIGWVARSGSSARAIGDRIEDTQRPPEVLFDDRIREGDKQYTKYSNEFAARLRHYADENLDKLFEECVAAVKNRDTEVGNLLRLLESIDVPIENVAAVLRKHASLLETIIFERFNADLMDELRALVSDDAYPSWMFRVLREWTHVDNKESMLVEDTIAKLFEDEHLVAATVKAYVRRESERDGWSHDDSVQRDVNKRRDFLETLDRHVGVALTKGRTEVLRLVEQHFPSNSPIPDRPASTKQP